MAVFKRVSIKKFHEFALWIFIAAVLSISISAAGGELVWFVDVAASYGVTAKNEYGGRDRKDFIVETTGNGVAHSMRIRTAIRISCCSMAPPSVARTLLLPAYPISTGTMEKDTLSLPGRRVGSITRDGHRGSAPATLTTTAAQTF